MSTAGEREDRTEMKYIRNQAIHAAKDLQYDPKCITELKAAKTSDEISKIMCRYRHNKFD